VRREKMKILVKAEKYAKWSKKNVLTKQSVQVQKVQQKD